MSQKNLSQHNRFLQALTPAVNAAKISEETESALLKLHAVGKELRFAAKAQLEELAAKAYDEDALLAVKLFFQTGDVRGGKGESAIFDACLSFLAKERPALLKELLPLIPLYARWDALLPFTADENVEIAGEAAAIVAGQLHDDVASLQALQKGERAKVSSLAKYLPTVPVKKAEDKNVLTALLKASNLSEREYVSALSELTAYLNEKQSSKRESAKLEAYATRQLLPYTAFLYKTISAKFHAYVTSLQDKTLEPSAKDVSPIEICHAYEIGDWRGIFTPNADYEALWAMLPKEETRKTLVVRDGSMSMTRLLCDSSHATMLEAADALTIYFSERLTGSFKNKFITFSVKPRLVSLTTAEALSDRLGLIESHEECNNMDFTAVLDLILDAAVSEILKQEDLPSYILFLTDMDFDVARGSGWDMEGTDVAGNRKALFESIQNKWKIAGYQMPKIVFWNLNGKADGATPGSENGILYINGYRPEMLEEVLSEGYEKAKSIAATEPEVSEATAMNQLTAKLNSERYDLIESILKPILTE